MIPNSLEEILRLNLFSALLTAVAVGVFFKTTLVLHRSSMVFQRRYRKQKETNDHRFIFASALASIVVGCSTTFWSQSTAIEVYALHLLLVLLTTWSFVRGLEEQLKELSVISQKLVVFAFVLGLSFSNHMSTILLAPGFLWLYFRTFGLHKASFLRITKISPFFLLGLSIYLYLPIRSGSRPLIDWGHPASLEQFFWHISGKEYRYWMFSGWGVVQKQLNYFISSFTSEFHIIIVPCILLGLFVLFKKSQRLLTFLVLLFCITIVYSINYDIFDIGSYFLLSYLVTGWVIVYGIDFFFHWVEDRQFWIRVIVAAMLIAIPIVQIVFNWNRVDETMNRLPQQFVRESFSRLEPNAVVLASQYEYFLSPSLYYQYIRNERRDITVIDESKLQNHSWYYLYLEQQQPWLMNRIRTNANLYLGELYKFEHDLPFNFNVMQVHWSALLSEIVEKSLQDRSVYVDAWIDEEFAQYRQTPVGLFIRLTKTEDTTCYRTAFSYFDPWNKQDPIAKDFEQYYVTILLHDADWLLRHGRVDAARTVLSEVFRIEPGNVSAAWLMRQVGK
jgi:hypothetical protein